MSSKDTMIRVRCKFSTEKLENFWKFELLATRTLKEGQVIEHNQDISLKYKQVNYVISKLGAICKFCNLQTFCDFGWFFVNFLFLLLACLSVNFFLPISKTPCESLNAALSCHVTMTWKGATLCQKEGTQQFSQTEYCRLFAFKKARPRRKGGRGHGHPRTPRP